MPGQPDGRLNLGRRSRDDRPSKGPSTVGIRAKSYGLKARLRGHQPGGNGSVSPIGQIVKSPSSPPVSVRSGGIRNSPIAACLVEGSQTHYGGDSLSDRGEGKKPKGDKSFRGVVGQGRGRTADLPIFSLSEAARDQSRQTPSICRPPCLPGARPGIWIGCHAEPVAPLPSNPQLLTLHALRLQGYAPTARIAARFTLDETLVAEALLDFQASGWVTHSEFAGRGGWSLTELGRQANQRQLMAELAQRSPEVTTAVTEVHREFLPLNERFQEAVTRWQIRPLPGDPLASNDHTDHRWDDRVIDNLATLGRRLTPLCERLVHALPRFNGYDQRYHAALTRVQHGKYRWVDAIEDDSCHRVWFELHEDLLATLGIERGQEPH